jgi:acetolactate synthase-1/2/3 large subunit
MACVCVTSGPGAINALNGVVGAYQDSIPMIVLSGQTKTSLMTVNSGLDLRTLGNQEFDIMSTLSKATKFSQTVMNAKDIRYCLEKAFFIALSGRPGPCWLEIPVDIQSAYIESDNLVAFTEDSTNEISLIPTVDSENILIEKINKINKLIRDSKRPILYAGNGIRISGAANLFLEFVRLTRIPVVTCWDSIDLIETDNDFYVGRAGTMGDRAGNFAVQNSDLVIAIGSRLNIYQVGYQLSSWAREATTVVVDVDPLELKKKTIRADIPVCADAFKFITLLYNSFKSSKDKFFVSFNNWHDQCVKWKNKYPVVQDKHYSLSNKKGPKQALSENRLSSKKEFSSFSEDSNSKVNVYALVDSLSRSLSEDSVTVVANGSASVVGSAAYYIKKGQRFIMNCGLSSMGYDLPAAIGVATELLYSSSIKNSLTRQKSVICLAGDGSIMMNLQELQTIVTNNLPIKIVLINNEGYQQIRLTQTNIFNKNFVGLGPDSHDLSFPNFCKIFNAFGIPYHSCSSNAELRDSISWLNEQSSYSALEVFCSTEQVFEPKSSAKRLEDGSIISPPLEDLAPFLSREELKENMIIDLWSEDKK